MLKPTFKKIIFSILFSLFLFLFSVSTAAAAPRLYFEPTAKTAVKDTEFEISVKIDVESQQAFGSDAVINFPGSDLEIANVATGGFFTDFSKATGNGKIEIHGYFANLYDSKSGSGIFAVIKFKTKTDAGKAIVSFSCSGTNPETQILNSAGNNILACSSLNQSEITFASANVGGDDDDSTPTPTPGLGEPNSCGGTCGSNYNCKAELFCYNGYCRNPFCKNQTNCLCPTATATPQKTATPKPLISTTPQIIVLDQYTSASATPTQTATPAGEISEGKNADASGKINWPLVAKIAGAIFILILIFKLITKLKNKSNPPQINPPVSTPPLPTIPQSPSSQTF